MTPQPQNNPPFGPHAGWTWSNGLAHLRAHGLDGEIRRIESAVVQDFDYDPAGRIVGQHLWGQTDPFQNDTLSSFSLDPAGRLTQARTEVAQPQGVASDSLVYAYDPNGNRQSLAWNAAATRYGYSGNRLAWSSGAAPSCSRPWSNGPRVSRIWPSPASFTRRDAMSTAPSNDVSFELEVSFGSTSTYM